MNGPTINRPETEIQKQFQTLFSSLLPCPLAVCPFFFLPISQTHSLLSFLLVSLFFFLPSPAFSSTFFPFRSSSTTISKLLYLPSCPSWTHLSMKTKTSQIVLGERLRAVVFRVPMIGEGTSLQQAPPLIPFPFDIFSLSV